MFTVYCLLWVIKEAGESWTGEYFHKTILTDNVLPFLRDEDNVLDVPEVCFLHDKAPCFKALATQELLRQSSINFFNNSECRAHLQT